VLRAIAGFGRSRKRTDTPASPDHDDRNVVAKAIAHRAARCPPNAIVTLFGAERASARELRDVR
jgi:hypothetical protein